jgi:hypothetical protein
MLKPVANLLPVSNLPPVSTIPGVNDTDGKFATGIVDTGGKQWEQLSNC